MTWSVVAKDSESGALGIIVASKFFAAASGGVFIRSGVGAVATQALTNPLYGPRGLRLLGEAVSVQTTVDILIASDGGRDHRQVHLVDRYGATAAYTGSACIEWCGDMQGDSFSVAGNMLAGPKVLEETYHTYETNPGMPFAERLLLALEAGHVAGGDKRGSQGAALLIYTTEEYPILDIRVDDHPDAVGELRRLYEKSKKDFTPWIMVAPTTANPHGIYESEEVDRLLGNNPKLS